MKDRIFKTSLRKGSLYLWEGLQKFKNMDRSTLVVDSEFNKKKSVRTKRGGKSKLVDINPNDFIIKAFKDDECVSLSIFNVISVDIKEKQAITKLVFRHKNSNDPEKIVEDLQQEYIDGFFDVQLKFNEKLHKMIEKARKHF